VRNSQQLRRKSAYLSSFTEETCVSPKYYGGTSRYRERFVNESAAGYYSQTTAYVVGHEIYGDRETKELRRDS